jgi:hypothetical protein
MRRMVLPSVPRRPCSSNVAPHGGRPRGIGAAPPVSRASCVHASVCDRRRLRSARGSNASFGNFSSTGRVLSQRGLILLRFIEPIPAA